MPPSPPTPLSPADRAAAAMDPLAAPPTAPAPRHLLRDTGAWAALVGAVGVLLFVYHYLAALAERQPSAALPHFINESTGAFCVGLLYFPIRGLVRRWPLAPGRRARRLPLYLLAMVAGGAASTTAIWGLRTLLYRLAGLGAFDYGVMPLRYAMELPIQLIAETIMITGLHAFAALNRARARELAAARIEGSLARAQLQNLRLQLQPHFLFNALHTISSTMYDDPVAADEMLQQLAELLRLSLSTARADEVPLAQELALLARYTAIQRARFGDRLTLHLDVDPGAEALLVPSLFLQPLVENAIRHGAAERHGRGAIAVRAHLAGDDLVLEVEDDGPPPSTVADAPAGAVGDNVSPRAPSATPSPAGLGLGLAATAERLQLLYGDRHRFTAAPTAHGTGFLVRAVLPQRPAVPIAIGADAPTASEPS
jgi:two-component system LytT family sensor kinase